MTTNQALLPHEPAATPRATPMRCCCAAARSTSPARGGWDARRQGGRATTSAEQAKLALANVAAVLHAGGARPEHIVRMTWYVTSKREYLAAGRDIGTAFRAIIGHYDIAMTAVEVTALMEDRAKVEIEVTPSCPTERHRQQETDMARAKASFHWDDPLLLDQQLGDDERAVREAARA